MQNHERYLASRLGIYAHQIQNTPFGWEISADEDDYSNTPPAQPSSSITYLTLALVSLSALVMLLAFGFSPKAQASSITKHGTLQHAPITSLARVQNGTRPFRSCDCHVPNAQWVLERRIPVPVPAPRPGPRPGPVIPRPNPPAVG